MGDSWDVVGTGGELSSQPCGREIFLGDPEHAIHAPHEGFLNGTHGDSVTKNRELSPPREDWDNLPGSKCTPLRSAFVCVKQDYTFRDPS